MRYLGLVKNGGTFALKLTNMDRKDFCTLLVNCRESHGCGKNEMCRRMGITFSQFQRIEDVSTNFALEKALNYLGVFKCCIRVVNDYSEFQIYSICDVINWFRTLKSDTTATLLSKISKVPSTTICSILLGETKMTIDVFLKLANFYNCNITIEKYAQE